MINMKRTIYALIIISILIIGIIRTDSVPNKDIKFEYLNSDVISNNIGIKISKNESNDVIIPLSKIVWKIKPKQIFLHLTFPLCTINSIRQMNLNYTYEKLRTFFSNCQTPEDFYFRMQNYIRDAGVEAEPDFPNIFEIPSLSQTADSIIDYNASLYCLRQTILLAAGIKAMFSHFDSSVNDYVLDDNHSHFKLEIWRSFDLHKPILPYRTHYQLVIDMWDGKDYFNVNNKIVDKIEIDTWENEFREFNKRNDCLFFPFFPAKLDSLFITTNSIFH